MEEWGLINGQKALIHDLERIAVKAVVDLDYILPVVPIFSEKMSGGSTW